MLHTDSWEQNSENSKVDLLKSLSIGRISFLTFEEKKILSKNIDSAIKLSLLSIEEIEKITGKKHNSKAVWNGKENLHCAEVALHHCTTMKIQILLFDDEKYPEILRQIPDPPYLLFCRGNVEILTSGTSVSVVGTRKITAEGKAAARNFAYEAVKKGCNVISGLANGVDGCAHQGAIDAYFDELDKGKNLSTMGKTVAVLPSAIDEIVPSGHKRMAQQILQSGGLIISEYEPGMNLAKWHFVGRNRIIAGLSPATVVIEAPAGSGALITADFAVEYNRDLMFHQAAFGKMAAKIAEHVHEQLESEHAKGTVSKYKLENCPEKFIEAGAPVIKDFDDYCRCLSENPGSRSNKPIQGTLFE